MTEERAPYHTDDKPQPCMLAIGNAFDGMRLCGPFDSAELAAEFAESNIDPCEWQIVPIADRAEFYDLTPSRRAAFDLLVQMGYTPERSRGWHLYWTADGEEIAPSSLTEKSAMYWYNLTR
jgi:hypothetical protein